MVYFEHNFQDGTGLRIADVPNDRLQREIPTIQFRISAQGQRAKLINCPLYDFDTSEDLMDKLTNGIMQLKLEEIGRQCDKCDNFFLPTSPAQKHCESCRESK